MAPQAPKHYQHPPQPHGDVTSRQTRKLQVVLLGQPGFSMWLLGLASPIVFGTPSLDLLTCWLGCGLKYRWNQHWISPNLRKCGTHQISLIHNHDNFLDKPLNRNPSCLAHSFESCCHSQSTNYLPRYPHQNSPSSFELSGRLQGHTQCKSIIHTWRPVIPMINRLGKPPLKAGYIWSYITPSFLGGG